MEANQECRAWNEFCAYDRYRPHGGKKSFASCLQDSGQGSHTEGSYACFPTEGAPNWGPGVGEANLTELEKLLADDDDEFCAVLDPSVIGYGLSDSDSESSDGSAAEGV